MAWERVGMIYRWRGGDTFPEPDDDELVEYGWQYGRTHGTPAGYQQHIYRGEEACVSCRIAKREQGRQRRAAGQEGAA